MAEMDELGFIKGFKCLHTNLLNLPFLENLCTVCEISRHVIYTCPYYKIKDNSYYTKMLKVSFLKKSNLI